MKKRLTKLFALLVVLALCVGFLEGLCTALAWWQYKTVDVQKLNDLDIGNTEISERDVPYAKRLVPHPYLSIAASPIDRHTNNVGGEGPDFPLKKDTSKFTILLTGGSVAHQLVRSGEMDRALAQYDFGKPVLVLNGGFGARQQPQQFILTGLYGEIADAVVTLDGYNEHYMLEGIRDRLETPNSEFTRLNPILENGYDRLAASWQCNQLRAFSREHNWRFLFFATKAIRNRIEASAAKVEQPSGEFFQMPAEWNPEERTAFNAELYRKYIRLIHAMCGELKLKDAYFVQPCPAIGKKLTPEEVQVVRKLSYAEAYRHLNAELLKLNERGIPVVSLLDCFNNTPETVYVDVIHNNQAGYAIMAERVARELAKLWSVPAK